jgi:hypothetical protein
VLQRRRPHLVILENIVRAHNDRVDVTLPVRLAAGERPEHDDASGWNLERGCFGAKLRECRLSRIGEADDCLCCDVLTHQSEL